MCLHKGSDFGKRERCFNLISRRAFLQQVDVSQGNHVAVQLHVILYQLEALHKAHETNTCGMLEIFSVAAAEG
jgi:hypothetical protein